jgi:dihydroflavonol-4-reductase
VEVVRADICDRAAVRRAVSGIDRVYHLAANPNLWTRDRQDFDRVNHRGALNVLHEALDAGVNRIVHVSTESILAGGHNGTLPRASRSGGKGEHGSGRGGKGNGNGSLLGPNNGHALVGPYCRSKYMAEVEAFRLAAAGAPVIVVNPTLPVGPGDRRVTPLTRVSLAFCRGKLPALLDCGLNMMDVRDIAQGLVAAMAVGQPNRRYVLGAHNLTLSQWFALLGQQINRPAPRFRLPYRLALAVGYLSELAADHFTGRMPMATVTGVRLARRSLYFDTDHTLHELGLRPRPPEESAAQTIRWYRGAGWL